jgi:ADP-heptose:LPS heptosyltransferase
LPKFLIIRFSSIGDIVLTTPVIRCLKKQVPDATIHFLSKKVFYPILASNPYIDHLHLMDEDLQEVIGNLKKEKFDYIIDLHHNLRTLRVKYAIGAKAISFEKLNIEKWLMVNFKWNRLPALHIVDRYLETVSSFGVRNDGQGLDYFLAESDRVHENDIPTPHQAGFIGIAIGGLHATKKLPLHKLTELCTKIEHPIILLGGKEDYADGSTIAEADPIKIYNSCGKFSINESADLVRRAKFIITHDTGLMHIAAAFKKPIISIWGNTIPEFGMYAYYGNIQIPNSQFQISNLACRPCSKIGFDQCPRKHFKCMELINVEELVSLVKEWLRGKIGS